MKYFKTDRYRIKVINDLIILKIPYNDKVLPAQFFMIGSDKSPALLNRPFSVSDFCNNILTFRIKLIGKFTNFLKELKENDTLRIIGPCGNGFNLEYFDKYDNIFLIGGGIGIAPLLYIYRLLKKDKNVYFIAGFPSKSYLYYLNDTIIPDLIVFTEDGSYGKKGYPIDYFKNKTFENSLIIACGPQQMYKALKEMKVDIDTKILMEQVMACGFGACLGCVINTLNGYKRVCVDGPVFNLNEVIFND